MSAAVIVTSLMMMSSIVSEESLARGTHTHTHTRKDRLGSSTLKFAINFANKKDKKKSHIQLGNRENNLVLLKSYY